MRFCKKPVAIDAELYDGSPDEAKRLAEWCRGTTAHYGNPRRYVVIISTLEGMMRAEPGDWIICGVRGEFYPCKPDIFTETYNPLPPQEPER